ncbi:hypothetical protein JET14_17265 [Martelella lutilitoris]|uniref:TnsA endonuclease N-terminal domain-containing protein n=1 Tax=Martelella lutilitoris TaxID=2583532 RepID=A0A7T7KKV4_9HYPH|nr:hypothetical protein [Martelella lutilitoris]QQM30017.1 hypothetical protein JET14_17265 [Martelella lutilitoris]
MVGLVINDSDADPGRITRCGSLGEYRTRLLMLADPDTVDVLEQVGPIAWQDRKGKTHSHFLDHVAIKRDGRRLGFTDKPYRRVRPDFEYEISQVCAEAKRRGIIDELYLVTEYARDPIDLHNADLMRGCRDDEPEVDEIALDVILNMTAPRTMRDLVREIDRGPRGFRALVRRLHSGQLKQIKKEKITLDTSVVTGGVGDE